MAWTIALLLITGTIIYRKCRVFESRKYAWVPLGIFLGGFALCALSFAEIYTFHKMPECFCLTFAAFWESCLQVGLLPGVEHHPPFQPGGDGVDGDALEIVALTPGKHGDRYFVNLRRRQNEDDVGRRFLQCL